MMSVATIDPDKVLASASNVRLPTNWLGKWFKSRFSSAADPFSETGLGRYVG